MNGSFNAAIFPVDLIKKGEAFDNFHIKDLDLSIYFAQIPDQRDELGDQYELLSLRNFIFLSQRDGCNRIIYVGRAHDKRRLEAVEILFKELGVQYTILLKDVAIGRGTSFEQFVQHLLKHRVIFLYDRLCHVQIRPVLLRDLFAFIKKINWQNDFVCRYLEFRGKRLMTINELIGLYIQARRANTYYKIVPIRNRALARCLNKLLYRMDSQVYDECMFDMGKPCVAENSSWQQQVEFAAVPIEREIY